MRAAVLRSDRLEVDEVPDPRPGPGQVLVRTLACGICGTDLHAVKHGRRMAEVMAEGAAGGIEAVDLDRDVIMGHEVCGEIVELGPQVSGWRPGEVVTGLPTVIDERGAHQVGFSNEYPGGFGELVVFDAERTLRPEPGVDPRHVSLTEPLAVGIHAVNRSGIVPGEAAVVLGAGPVGVAVVAALVRRGIEPIVVSDYSPRRRELAAVLGAHTVVDPATDQPVDAWRREGGRGPLVMFEAVGVPGMIDESMRTAPFGSRILVVGACMEPDEIRPIRGIGRELTISFSMAFAPDEFAESLAVIGAGEVNAEALISGSVPIGRVPDAFLELANPEAHAKLVVDPSL